MRKYRLSEELGNIDETFLEEVFEYQSKKRRIHMSIKKIAAIAACVLFVISAATLCLRHQSNIPVKPITDEDVYVIEVEHPYTDIMAVGETAIISARSGCGLFDIKQHFDNVEDKFGNVANMPVIDSAEIYGTEIDSTVETPEVLAKITGVACDEHTIFVTMEFNAFGLDIPDESPDEENAMKFGFRSAYVAQSGGGGIRSYTQDGYVFNYFLCFHGFDKLPDEDIIVELRDFGYYTTTMLYTFVPLYEGDIELVIPRSELNIMPAVMAENTAEISGIEFEVELSPFGILLTSDYEKMVESGLDYDKYFLSVTSFEFHMRDGRVVGDGKTYESVYNFMVAQSGWVDFDTGVRKNYFGFSVPIDISQIEYITVNGVPFYFATDE